MSGVFKKISNVLPKGDDDNYKPAPFAGHHSRDNLNQRGVTVADYTDWNDTDHLSLQYGESDEDDVICHLYISIARIASKYHMRFIKWLIITIDNKCVTMVNHSYINVWLLCLYLFHWNKTTPWSLKWQVLYVSCFTLTVVCRMKTIWTRFIPGVYPDKTMVVGARTAQCQRESSRMPWKLNSPPPHIDWREMAVISPNWQKVCQNTPLHLKICPQRLPLGDKLYCCLLSQYS